MNLRLNWKKYDEYRESALFKGFTIEVTYSSFTECWQYLITNVDAEYVEERGFPFDNKETAKQEAEEHLIDFLRDQLKDVQGMLDELET